MVYASSSTISSRALWLEFDGRPLDPQDGYFPRVLAYGIDPLLGSEVAGNLQPLERTLGVESVPIRAIAPGASVDTAGLGAMTPLIQSKLSNKHYLLPLPAGIIDDSAQLFGFWTYELRVGHYPDPNTSEPVWPPRRPALGGRCA